jgi:hypothetical protein
MGSTNPMLESYRSGTEQAELGTFVSRTTLSGMEFERRVKPPVSKAEREAKQKKMRAEAEKALAERKQADDTFRANYERLKAERLARTGKDNE